MAIFPRPVSPRSAAGDLWSYLSEKRPHKWPLLGVSTALTGLIIWAFLVDANTNTMPTRNKITYFQSWDSNRTDAQVILQQKIDLAEREIALRKKQKEMQKVADIFGIEWRKDAERNDTRRREALMYLNAELDRKLAAAQQETDGNGARPAPQNPAAEAAESEGPAPADQPASAAQAESAGRPAPAAQIAAQPVTPADPDPKGQP